MTDIQKKDQVSKPSTDHVPDLVPKTHISDVEGAEVVEVEGEEMPTLPTEHVPKPKPLEA